MTYQSERYETPERVDSFRHKPKTELTNPMTSHNPRPMSLTSGDAGAEERTMSKIPLSSLWALGRSCSGRKAFGGLLVPVVQQTLGGLLTFVPPSVLYGLSRRFA